MSSLPSLLEALSPRSADACVVYSEALLQALLLWNVEFCCRLMYGDSKLKVDDTKDAFVWTDDGVL